MEVLGINLVFPIVFGEMIIYQTLYHKVFLKNTFHTVDTELNTEKSDKFDTRISFYTIIHLATI